MIVSLFLVRLGYLALVSASEGLAWDFVHITRCSALLCILLEAVSFFERMLLPLRNVH